MHLADEDVLVTQHILNALGALRQRGFAFFYWWRLGKDSLSDELL